MFRARLRDVTVDRILVGETSVELVSAESALVISGADFGWALRYRRPIRVDSIAIRDHVMVARISVIAAALVIVIRRLTS